MMVVSREQLRPVKEQAKKRGIKIQEMIRVMVPEWLEHEHKKTR
jgi:predicted DNA binding CopG/RHH family protein